MQTFDAFDGALLIDKPVGPTSHDVVAAIRRQFQVPKVGHCGTLDPNATGLLVLVLGKATRLSEKLMSDDKVYEGTLTLGLATTTYDAQGTVTSTLPVPPLTLNDLNQAAARFVGDHMQRPPMVSAVKQGGVPLYKLARKGIEVERKDRLVHIYTFAFSQYTPPTAHFRVACTKGTYVRSLAHDLGQNLGCGAHLATLRRLSSGRFDVAQSLTLDRALELPAPELQKHIIPFLQLVGTANTP